MDHKTLVTEARTKYPEALDDSFALSRLSLEVFEQLIATDIRDENYTDLRTKYFAIRAAYEHECYRIRNQSSFKQIHPGVQQ